jgi:hypothetical protein
MSDITNRYYPGEAITGYGAQLLVGQGTTPETYVAIADVMEITPGDMTTEVTDITHLRSPEAHREKKATLRDSGAFALSGNWRPRHGSQNNVGGDGFNIGLIGLWRTRQERNFVLQVPTETPGTPIPVTGIVQAAGVATVTSTAAHGLTTGDTVSMAGAAQGEYNGVKTITVVTPTTFTYAVATGTVTPATGTIVATPLESLELPFRGVVTKFQPGAVGLTEKVPFTAEITPLRDFSAALP